jgi:hypothetical protein
MDDLTEDNFLLFAAKHYYSVHYSMTEFNSDLKRIIYIKRLLKKYKKSGELAVLRPEVGGTVGQWLHGAAVHRGGQLHAPSDV